MKKLFALLLIFVISIGFIACNKVADEGDLWQDALYTEDVLLGEGEKTLTVDVVAADKAVTFTICTDKDTVGAALAENNLIDGEKGPYGLYVKTVNGITADYDINQTYWEFTENGEYMQTGVDVTKFNDGDKFELTYAK